MPLPLVGAFFWIGGSWLSTWTLSQAQMPEAHLQANTQLETQLPVAVILIEAEIHRENGFSKVEVKTANPNLKRLEFEFPVLAYEQVEAAIAQQLGLSAADVRPIIRFEIKR